MRQLILFGFKGKSEKNLKAFFQLEFSVEGYSYGVETNQVNRPVTGTTERYSGRTFSFFPPFSKRRGLGPAAFCCPRRMPLRVQNSCKNPTDYRN
jgi:hypothetical protein